MDNNKTDEDKQKLEHVDKSRVTLKRIKIATFAVIGFLALALSVTIGVNATSTNTFCASCHMMTPQAMTWEASSHSSIKCKDCHIKPGLQGTVDAKIGGLSELYHMATDSYGAPIRMKEDIPNKNCLKCHNMKNKDVTASGDIIIDHQIHDEQEINCVTCHDGVAHGKVSANQVTHKSDYDRWDEDLADQFMKDPKYVKPQMDKCIDCHELRNAPVTCETCHSTGMVPDNHQEKNFMTNQHGKLAEEDLLLCNSCHSYMSDKPIKELKEQKQYAEFLNKNSEQKLMTAQEYAKKNTFCVDCHSEAPSSHEKAAFFGDHGSYVQNNDDSCLTCHANDQFTESPITSVTCASCHPSGHKDEWQKNHKRKPISENQKIDGTCVGCHVEETCTSCHVDRKSKKEI